MFEEEEETLKHLRSLLRKGRERATRLCEEERVVAWCVSHCSFWREKGGRTGGGIPG